MSSISPVRIVGLKAERRTDGGPVATPTPRLSWVTESSVDGWLQASAELERDGQTAQIEGDSSVFVAWPFAPLAPREQASVRVRVVGQDGSESEWSEPVSITAGFLADGEWQARFVGLAEPGAEAQPALLRREFTIAHPLARATLYSTARRSAAVRTPDPQSRPRGAGAVWLSLCGDPPPQHALA